MEVQHALADPEIQTMLHDPQAALDTVWIFGGLVTSGTLPPFQVRQFLKTLQENPAEGQKAGSLVYNGNLHELHT